MKKQRESHKVKLALPRTWGKVATTLRVRQLSYQSKFGNCSQIGKNCMLSSTVIGVELHRLGLKFNLTKIELEWSCTRWSTTDSNQVHRGQVEVQRGEAELDFNLAEMDLTEVARGGPALTPLKATESKSKFNEAQPSWTWTWTRWPWAEVARGAAQVHWGKSIEAKWNIVQYISFEQTSVLNLPKTQTTISSREFTSDVTRTHLKSQKSKNSHLKSFPGLWMIF